jgi:hypothetical protein
MLSRGGVRPTGSSDCATDATGRVPSNVMAVIMLKIIRFARMPEEKGL